MSEYTYYPGGLRSSKRVNGETTRFVYHESRIIAELGEDYGLKASNLFGSGILFREAGDKTISYLTDGHGDVVGISDAFGKVTSRKEYEPFGKERQPEATGFGKGILRELQREEADGADNPFGYCGEYLDEETGFIYLRARYYSPDTGRFVSEDPIRDGLNWYTYCVNNPLRYIDPTGMIVTKWDENHCSDDELKLLQDYTKAYEDGNKEAHKWAESIRDRHRGENEVGTDLGYTVNLSGPSGKLFATADEAAINWASENYDITSYLRLELSSLIYAVYENSELVGYSYTPFIVGQPHSTGSDWWNLEAVPPNGVIIGSIHSHPSGQDLSAEDKKISEAFYETSYVVFMPSNGSVNVSKYGDTRRGFVQSIIAQNIYVVRYSEEMLSWYAGEYGYRWFDHLRNCGRGCRTKDWPND